MLLVKQYEIRKTSNPEVYAMLDNFCFLSKNLYNLTNYYIRQGYFITRKLASGEILDSKEKAFLKNLNEAVKKYNSSSKRKIRYFDSTHKVPCDAYFLDRVLKGKNYSEMPSATAAQQCIQAVCREWKGYFESIRAKKLKGIPRPPKYKDKKNGRYPITLTANACKIRDGYICFPKTFKGFEIKTELQSLQQVRIRTTKTKAIIEVIYNVEEKEMKPDNNRVIGIDIGIDNFVTIVNNIGDNAILIDGKGLKSINTYYNKRKAKYQRIAKLCNQRYQTNRIERLTGKRNSKVKDFIHKVSRYIVNYALQNDINTVIIGYNEEWKQNIDLGKIVNQKFVSIPYYMLLQQLKYKCKQEGITLIVTEESYTSGTSYLDNELPTKSNYNKNRRACRGLFKSNKGIEINADINAAFQIIKKVNPNYLQGNEVITGKRMYLL
ncbi:transposase [bacterium]|nr:transposase [bacterium]